MFLGLLCALELREEKLLHEPKDVAKSQDYKVLERLFEELTKCKEDDQQREFFLENILILFYHDSKPQEQLARQD